MSKLTKDEHNPKREFLERICRMYYILDMGQKDIAEQLNIGRSSVARFLKEAKSEGVVRFYITSKSDSTRRTDLENQLLNRYKLKDIVVVKSDNSLFETTTVDYLNGILPYQGSIGLGWGKTIHQVGKFLHMCESRPNLKVIQMSGSVGGMERDLPATSVIQNWAQSLGATPHFLPAPVIVDSKQTKEFFLQDRNILKSFKEIKNIDISIVGIGTTHSDSAIFEANLVPNLTSEELTSKSVGDVLLHFYNEQGDFTMNDISERVVGTSPVDLLRVPTRVALAYGIEKIEAIKGALEGKLINILITTDETAKLLL